MALARYIGRKVAWTLVVFVVALLLNFLLPRLIPGNPVDAIIGQLAQGGGAGGEQLKQIHEQYTREFGLDKPLWQQFLIYVGNVFQGDLGTSFANYPAPVGDLIKAALPWSLAIMLPAIIVGWIVGNLLGAVAAFKGGWLDRGLHWVAVLVQRSAVCAGDHLVVPRRGEGGHPAGRRSVLLRFVARVLASVLR